MPFPETPRVRYGKSPLAEVVCDLRFPSILRIDSEIPAAFQEQVRGDYPVYQRGNTAQVNLPPNVPPQIAQMMLGFMVPQNVGVRHEFHSEDKTYMVALTQGGLDLRTTKYSYWEDFRTRLERLVTTLDNIYAPAAFTRIGLRYVDVIRRSKLGLEATTWSALLRPEVAGELASPEVWQLIDSSSRQMHMRLSDQDEFLTLKTGLVTQPENSEKCFSIDSDFHTHGKTEKSNAFDKLDRFHTESGSLFRWCILEPLHAALEPGVR